MRPGRYPRPHGSQRHVEQNNCGSQAHVRATSSHGEGGTAIARWSAGLECTRLKRPERIAEPPSLRVACGHPPRPQAALPWGRRLPGLEASSRGRRTRTKPTESGNAVPPSTPWPSRTPSLHVGSVQPAALLPPEQFRIVRRAASGLVGSHNRPWKSGGPCPAQGEGRPGFPQG